MRDLEFEEAERLAAGDVAGRVIPRISIITAVYNRRDTLADALTSLGRQSYAEVEHIIVDGGSTDGSLDLIETHATPHSVVISEPDDGIYDALNKGLSHATGDVIGLLHSDDIFAHGDVLSHVAAAFEAGADAVYGDLDYVHRSAPDRIIRQWRSGAFHPSRLSFGWMPPHPALFLRRAVIDRFGGYDTSFRISGDYDTVLRYFSSEGFDARYIPEVLVKMRLGGESNRSLGRILTKTGEDLRAIRANGIGGVHTLFLKNLRKVRQFL